FPFDIQLNVVLPDVLDAQQDSITEVIIVPANSSTQSVISLDNTTMNLGDGILDFSITAATLSNNQSYVMNAADEITTTVTVTELRFSSVTADVNIGTEFPSFEEDVVDLDFDIPDINFHDMTLTLTFSNTPADIDIDIRLEGYKSGETPIIANYAFSLNGDLNTNTVVLSNTGVTVNGVPSGTGSGLVDVINMLPERIAFSGSAQIDDDSATLTADPIGIEYTVDVGFLYSLPEGAVFEGDTIDINFNSDDPVEDKDIRELINDYFHGASLELTIANGIPIGGELMLRAADSTTALSTIPESWPVLFSFDFDPAPTNPETGAILDVPDQDVTFELTDEQVQVMSDSYFAYWFITLDPIVKGSIHSTDKIILRKSFLSGMVTVNSDFFDKVNNLGEEEKSNKSSSYKKR
ncbi:hypothetical protein AMJ80_07855, partial [bacterium SM23_31]